MDQRPAILILSAPMPPFSSMPYFSEALLAALALIPVALAWGMGFFGSRSEEVSRITTQSPLGTHEDHAPHDVLLTPLVHISRTDRAEDQRNLALGLRQVRVEQAAPLLRHFMRSTDPELALFSQSILQQGREQLQSRYNQLRTHAEPTDPRIAASLLETGLRLASLTLITPEERRTQLQVLNKKAHEHLTTCAPTPRLLAACVRVLLSSGDVASAADTMARLPEGSAFRRALAPQVEIGLHQSQILAATV